MPLVPPSSAADRERLRQAARALEALVLKQLVASSRAFTGGDGPGSAVRADLFADALADAMVRGGGIGLAQQIERSLGTPAPSSTPTLAPSSPAIQLPTSAPTSLSTATPTLFAPDTEIGDTALPRITSPFGQRQDPFSGHLARHDGVDLAGDEGAEVRAVAAGVVRRAGSRGGYGNAVEIDHGGGLTTVYGHASELLVRDGERVTPGQPIARVGHSGRATGPHLHFEVRAGGRPIDPARALKVYGLRADELIGAGS